MENSEVEIIQNKLMKCSKEELIDIIIDRALRDAALWHYINDRVSEPESIEQVMEEFLQSIKWAYSYSFPQINIIEDAADLCISKLDRFSDSLSKIQSYVTIIDILSKSLNDGAGFKTDDEFLLDDPIDTCLEKIYELITIALNEDDLTVIEEIREYLNRVGINDEFIWKEENLSRIFEILKLDK